MAVDMFLKLDGIDGESQDKSHPGEIEIEAFSWGASNPARIGSASGGAGAGKVSFQDFSFSMPTSKASPNLMLACATGQHIPTGQLTVRKSGGQQLEFLKIKLSDVLVSSYSLGESATGTGGDGPHGGGADVPTEALSLAFAKIDFVFTVQDTGEVVDTSFDLAANSVQ